VWLEGDNTRGLQPHEEGFAKKACKETDDNRECLLTRSAVCVMVSGSREHPFKNSPLPFLQNIGEVCSAIKTPPQCPTQHRKSHTNVTQCMLAHLGVHALQLFHLVGVDKGVAPRPFVVLHGTCAKPCRASVTNLLMSGWR